MIEQFAHLFERVFGLAAGNPKVKLRSHHAHDTLVQEGFSDAEATELAWFYTRKTNGRSYGFLFGVALAYTGDRWTRKITYSIPYLRLYSSSLWVTRALIVFGSVQLFDYFSSARRYGANNGFTNDIGWVNSRYSLSKEKFIQNFEVLNRGFTNIEKEIFSANQSNLNSPIKNRRWIYNPLLHGDDEESFWAGIKRNFIDKVAPWERYDVQQEIALANKDKIANGEQIKLKPYSLTNDIDHTGVKLGLRLSPITNRWNPI